MPNNIQYSRAFGGTILSTTGQPDGSHALNVVMVGGGGSNPTAVAWSTTWDTAGQKDMGQHTVAGATALVSSATGSILGGQTQAVLVSNGSNTPTVDGVPLAPYDTTTGGLTLVTLAYVGGGARWFSAPLLNTSAPSVSYLRFDALSSFTESGNGTTGWAYTGTGNSWTGSAAFATLGMASNGTFLIQYGGGGSIMVVFDTVAGNTIYQQPAANGVFLENSVNAVYNGVIGGGGGVNNLQQSVTHAVGDWIRFTRTGTDLVIEIARSATPSTFIPLHTFSGVTGTVRPRVHNNQIGSLAQKATGTGFA